MTPTPIYTPMTGPRILTYENRLLVLLTFSFGLVFFDRNAVNFLMPFIVADLGFSNTQVGMFAAGLSLTWAVSGFIIGMRADRAGKRKTYLVMAVLAFSLCSIFTGLAVSFLTLLLARMIMGAAEGPFMPLSQSLMVPASTPRRRGLNMGIVQTLGGSLLGGFAAPLIVIALAEAFHWRSAFFVAAVPGLLIAIYMIKAVQEPVSRTEAVPPSTTTHPAPVAGRTTGLAQVIKIRNVWLCVLICCFLFSWGIVGMTFLPLYFVNARGMSPGDMSILMAVLGVSSGLFGAFIGPGLSDRLGRKPVVIGFSLVGGIAPLALLNFNGSFVLLNILCFLGWSASGAFVLVMATIPAESIPPRYIASVVGLTQGVGEIAGGMLAPLLAGRMADRFNLAAPLVLMAACAITASVLACLLKETAPGKPSASGEIGEMGSVTYEKH